MLPRSADLSSRVCPGLLLLLSLLCRTVRFAFTPLSIYLTPAQSPPLSADADFDEILAPYASLLPPSQPNVQIPDPASIPQDKAKVDEWAGLL